MITEEEHENKLGFEPRESFNSTDNLVDNETRSLNTLREDSNVL